MSPNFAVSKLSLVAILFSALALISACAQTEPNASTATGEAGAAPTLAPNQLAFAVYEFTIPLPAGITENKSREMPGVGFTAIYNAPNLTEEAAQTHFDDIMPQLGFTSLGKVGPNFTYEKEEYTLRVLSPGDGFLILTMLKSVR